MLERRPGLRGALHLPVVRSVLCVMNRAVCL